ncbi:hypothetical protein ABEW20_06130 [Bacillus safensis]
MAALKGVKTLDMVDGEITKVAYEGAEYERVKGDAKVGDLVLITDDSWCDATEGSFYLSIDISDGDPVIVDDIDEKDSYYSDGYALFRKKHTRLKVGDYAKVLDEGEISITGDIVKITEDDRGIIPFRCDVITGKGAGDYFWAQESELVLATEDEVAAAKETEVKRANEAKWAKIGRKVDEYKVGDIVAYDDPYWFENKGFGEVIDGTDSDGDTLVEAVDHRGDIDCNYLVSEKLTLITPVEARFDRS